MRNLDKLSRDFAKAIIDGADKKTKSYDATAKVLRVENGIAWVHIPGGVDETPARLSVNAKPGDEVQIRVGGGSAWLTGNTTAPPADDSQKIESVSKELKITLKGDIEAKELEEEYLQYCLCNENFIPEGQKFENIQYTPWSTVFPGYVEGKYFWVRHVFTFTDGSATYGFPYYDGGTQFSFEREYEYTSDTAFVTGKLYETSLYLNDWEIDSDESGFEYVQTINLYGVTSSSILQWAPTADVIKECARIRLLGISSGSGIMTFGCDDMPTMNLPISVLLLGNVK